MFFEQPLITPRTPGHIAFFKERCLKLWLSCPNAEIYEIYVKDKGWVPYANLSVGDKTLYGTVAFIGTEEEEEVKTCIS